MKISSSSRRRLPERGSATLILFVLLSIMMILVAVNGRALVRIHQQIKSVEHKQVQRLQAQGTAGGNPSSTQEVK